MRTDRYGTPIPESAGTPLPPSEIEAVASIVHEAYPPQILEIANPDHDESNAEKVPVLLVPKGMETFSTKEFFDEYRTAPERRKGTATLTDPASFTTFTARHKGEASVIFADTNPSAPSLTTVFDYNPANGDNSDARFGQHRARYAFPLSEEWKAWTAINGKDISQAAFAEFLEKRALDVSDPSQAGEKAQRMNALLGLEFAGPAGLFSVARELAINVGRKIVNASNRGTGETTMVFAEEHTDKSGGKVTVPGAFLIAIPVFKGGALYAISARLRYRVREGLVFFAVELQRADAMLDDAIAEAANKAATDTELPLFYGSPEV